jgi:hypothetical protein
VKKLSNCCGATVINSTAVNYRTNDIVPYYICSGCSKPCDLLEDGTFEKFINNAIKEISVNREKIIEDYMKFYFAVNAYDLTPETFSKDFHLVIESGYADYNHVITYKMIPSSLTTVDAKEYERLKRLDENVKNEIEDVKQALEGAKLHPHLCRDLILELKCFLGRLEKIYITTLTSTSDKK